MSSAAYLLRQSGARKLLAAGYPIRVPSDHLTGGRIKTRVNLYGISPACIETLHPYDQPRAPSRKPSICDFEIVPAWHKWDAWP